MSSETVELVIEFLRHRSIKVLDLTGGAPELNPHFRHLARAARELGTDVIDRCNLTILSEPGQEDPEDPGHEGSPASPACRAGSRSRC